MTQEKDFFEKFGLEVKAGEVEVGETYPIYGMITEIIDDTPGSVIIEINFNIIANLTIEDEVKVEILKTRAFEPGIFVATITDKQDKKITVDCSTIVYGKFQGEKQ